MRGAREADLTVGWKGNMLGDGKKVGMGMGRGGELEDWVKIQRTNDGHDRESLLLGDQDVECLT